MDVYEFAAKLTESLAWPVVATIAIIVFRRDAKAGLDRLRKLDAFGVSAEFAALERLELAVSQAVIETAEETATGNQGQADGAGSPPPESNGPDEPGGPVRPNVPPPTGGGGQSQNTEPTPLDLPSAPPVLSPEAVISGEWAMLERLLRATYLEQPMFSLRGDRMPSLNTILDGLMSLGVLNQGQRDAILYARDVRNKIAHAKHYPSEDEARRYALATANIRRLIHLAAH